MTAVCTAADFQKACGLCDNGVDLSEPEANKNKKAVLPQGNRAMPQVFFSVEVRQQHFSQV